MAVRLGPSGPRRRAPGDAFGSGLLEGLDLNGDVLDLLFADASVPDGHGRLLLHEGITF
jgi:hypothetical protein